MAGIEELVDELERSYAEVQERMSDPLRRLRPEDRRRPEDHPLRVTGPVEGLRSERLRACALAGRQVLNRRREPVGQRAEPPPPHVVAVVVAAVVDLRKRDLDLLPEVHLYRKTLADRGCRGQGIAERTCR